MLAGTGGTGVTTTTNVQPTQTATHNPLSPTANNPGTYNTAIPGAFGSGGYADLAAAANLAYKNALARINQKRTSTLRQYGYLGNIDPASGVIKNMRVDPYNPYGELQMMLRGTAQDYQQAQWGNEDRGLFGGLANQAYSGVKYDAGKQSADLGTALQGNIGELQDEQNQAAYQRDQALAEAEMMAAENAIGSGSFDPGNYSGMSNPSKALQVVGKITGGLNYGTKSGGKKAAPPRGGGKPTSNSVPAWLAYQLAHSAAQHKRGR